MWEIERAMEKTLSKVDLIEVYQQIDRIYNVELHHNREMITEEKKMIGFSSRCKIENKKGFAYAHRAVEAVSQALKFSRESSASSGWMLPEGPSTYPSIDGLTSSSLAALSLDDFADYVCEARLASNFSSVNLLHRKIRVVNNLGVKAQKLETLMEVSLYFRKGDRTWKQHTQSRDLISIDTLENMSEKGMSGAQERKEARSVELGEGCLLVPGHLSPHLFRRYVLTVFRMPSILDQQIFTEDISLVDDGTLSKGLFSAPFDDEGVPCKRRKLVSKGKAVNIMLDSSGAAEQHAEATGNMMRASWQSSPHLTPHNILFLGEHDRKQLQESINFGIIATNFKVFLPLLSERQAGNVFLVIDGFLIRNGDIEYPVDNVKVKFNFFTSLRRVSKPYEEYQRPFLQDLLFEDVRFF